MEQPQEESPEAREEEKEEVATAEGAPQLNGGPEHALPSSSCTGTEEAEGQGRAGGGPGSCEQPGVPRSRVPATDARVQGPAVPVTSWGWGAVLGNHSPS